MAPIFSSKVQAISIGQNSCLAINYQARHSGDFHEISPLQIWMILVLPNLGKNIKELRDYNQWYCSLNVINLILYRYNLKSMHLYAIQQNRDLCQLFVDVLCTSVLSSQVHIFIFMPFFKFYLIMMHLILVSQFIQNHYNRVLYKLLIISMLSPIRNKNIDPFTLLAGNLLQLVIRAHVSIQEKQNSWKKNQQRLLSVYQQIKLLREHNQLLTQLEAKFDEIKSKCIVINRQYDETLIEQQVENDEQPNQNKIQVIVPDLTNLQQYFNALDSSAIVENYLKMKDLNKVEELKHTENIAKLAQKLRSVDIKVNQTLAAIKNQRKHF